MIRKLFLTTAAIAALSTSAAMAEVKLADVRLHFGEAYGFGTLRMVQAWMERQASGHS